MTKKVINSDAASGKDTFSDNLVGRQITNGSSLLTNTNFSVDRLITQRNVKNFKNGNFTEYFTLEDIKNENTEISVTNQTNKVIKFRPSKDDASKSLFGSLKLRISVAVNKIIENFPAGVLVNKDSFRRTFNETATNIVYDSDRDLTTFNVEFSKFSNPFDIVFISPVTNDLQQKNPLRGFYNSFRNYVIDINGLTSEIVSYNEPNVNGLMTFVVKGNPFESNVSFSDNFLIRPNNVIVEDFYGNLDDFESMFMDRETSPKYTIKFKIPEDNDTATKTVLKTVIYTWPISSDNWNITISGLDFEEFVNNLKAVGNTLDNYKSNLIIRFLTAPQLFEFDSEESRAESVFQLYGQNFDKVKKFIDNIAYMRNVSYDGINNVPDILLKNLANTLGFKTVNILLEKNLNDILYTRGESQFEGESIGMNLIEAEIEFYRRLVVNLSHIYRMKGTRKSIEFFMRFLGAPEPLIRIDEYSYQVTSLPKSTDIEGDVYDVINGTKEVVKLTFNEDSGEFDKTIETISVPYSRNSYPINFNNKLPQSILDPENDIFFQKGAGWFELTADHRSREIIDELESTLDGLNKSIVTRPKRFTYGEEYFDYFRKFPGLDDGFDLKSVIDNKRSYIGGQYSNLLLNRKNIGIYIDSSRGVDYDIWSKSKDNELSFGNLEPQIEESFAEYLSKTLNRLIKNSNVIRYRKNYIVLEDVYKNYLNSTTFKPYTFYGVNEFVNTITPYWVRIVEQFVPATTIWTGGNLITNGTLGRPKYKYEKPCLPLIILKNLYPDFTESINEDLETILGDEDNLRGLINVTSLIYYPQIIINGEIYGGPDYENLTPDMTVTVGGTTNVSGISAKLFDPFILTGCSKIYDSNTQLPLVCDFKEHINPDITQIQVLWKDALISLIENGINSGENQILNYEFFVDSDGIEKVRFISTDCESKEVSLEFNFDTQYNVTPKEDCNLFAEVYSFDKEIYPDGSQENCIVTTDVLIKFDGQSISPQKLADGWPVFVNHNCGTEVNTSITTLDIDQDSNCILRITDVKENDIIDLLFTDASNCQLRIKIDGLSLKMVHDPYSPRKSHFNEFTITSTTDDENCVIDEVTEASWCDDYLGYTPNPNVSYNNEVFNYGIKHNTKVMINNGATISPLTTKSDIEDYITSGTIIIKDVKEVLVGDEIITYIFNNPFDFNFINYNQGFINNDFSFIFGYTTRIVDKIECLGSVKTSKISTRDKNNNLEIFEVLPTTKFKIYTKKEFDNGNIILKDSYFFDERYPEYLQVKLENEEPCCVYNGDLVEPGDFLIGKTGRLYEVEKIELDYCTPELYYNISFTDNSILETFNGNDNEQVLSIFEIEEHNDNSFNIEQFYVNEENCPTVPEEGFSERNVDGFDVCDVEALSSIDENTQINIFVDTSGSMPTTVTRLNTMRDTLLKDCLIQFYNGNETLYNNNVRVINFSDERTFINTVLGRLGTNSGVTRVINIVFQDEADNRYHIGTNDPFDPFAARRTDYNADITSFRNTLNTVTPNYYTGIVFTVLTNGNGFLTWRGFIDSVKNGTGNYAVPFGLSDKLDYIQFDEALASETPQYYLNLITGTLNNLGYNITCQ